MHREISSYGGPRGGEGGTAQPQGDVSSPQNNEIVRSEDKDIGNSETGNTYTIREDSPASMIERQAEISEIERETQEKIEKIRNKLGISQTNEGPYSFASNDGQPESSEQQISESQSLERIGSVEIPPDHEKYHTVEAEQFRYDKVFTESNSSRRAHAKLGDLVSMYSPNSAFKSELSTITFNFDRMVEQQRKNFEDSLNNPNEQRVRKEQREAVINILESIYDKLNQEPFTSPDPNVRHLELLRVLNGTGIKFDNTEIQSLIERQYFKFKKPPEYIFSSQDTSGIIEDKDEFIKNGLTYFDPYIFAEAQERVLGKAKPVFTADDFLDASEHLSKQDIERRVDARNEYFKRNVFKINLGNKQK